MSTLTIILIATLVALVVIIVVLYIWGRRARKKQAEQQEQMDAIAQTMSMLVIEKKKPRVMKSGLPQQMLDQVPWYMKHSKIPVVRAKVGSKIMAFTCENGVYDVIPVRKEVKVVVSGLYITEVKSARGGLDIPQKKKGFFKRLLHRS